MTILPSSTDIKMFGKPLCKGGRGKGRGTNSNVGRESGDEMRKKLATGARAWGLWNPTKNYQGKAGKQWGGRSGIKCVCRKNRLGEETMVIKISKTQGFREIQQGSKGKKEKHTI